MLTKITLNRASADNASLFCDAGSTLIIGDAAEPGTITLAAAQALIDSCGAEAVDEPLPLAALPKIGKISADQ